MEKTTGRRSVEHLPERAAAGLVGAFALLNLVAGFFVEGFDQNRWWLDVRPLPGWVGAVLAGVTGALLCWWAVRPQMGDRRRRVTRGLLLLLTTAAVWDALMFYGLLALGRIDSGFPVPFSLLVAALLAWLWRGTVRARPVLRPWARWAVSAALAAGLPVLFALAQMVCFGTTDYRRPADAVVVFGAAVWADNCPSHALTDRVNTGIELYRAGLARVLVFSGGPSESGSDHETAVMRRMALEAGVPDVAIRLDAGGVNTQATAENTTALLRREGLSRVLAVSHFYHLPRVHMAFQRAGLTVYTVPAREEHVLVKLPYYLAREVAALWYYYLRPLWEVPSS